MDAPSESSDVRVATAPKRRWFRLRFSLRTMFIVLTVACLIGGYRMNKAIRQRTAVKRFYELTANRLAERGENATTMGFSRTVNSTMKAGDADALGIRRAAFSHVT